MFSSAFHQLVGRTIVCDLEVHEKLGMNPQETALRRD